LPCLTLCFIVQTGKAITFKGIQVLENVGKETMDLLISETGFEVEKKSDGADHQVDEEVSFDRCFYIYGGPEQLEVCLCCKLMRLSDRLIKVTTL